MLIGVGGSGKQSLAKLAVFMAELAPMTIVISKSYSLNDFKADLQVRITLRRQIYFGSGIAITERSSCGLIS